MTNKKTKKDLFLEVREVVAGNEELVAFIDHEVELLDKKSVKGGQTKTQKENEVVATMLIEELAKVNKPITITDLMNASETIANYRLENGNALSNQKISAIFKQLVENKTLIKVVDKKKSYFSIAD